MSDLCRHIGVYAHNRKSDRSTELHVTVCQKSESAHVCAGVRADVYAGMRVNMFLCCYGFPLTVQVLSGYVDLTVQRTADGDAPLVSTARSLSSWK